MRNDRRFISFSFVDRIALSEMSVSKTVPQMAIRNLTRFLHNRIETTLYPFDPCDAANIRVRFAPNVLRIERIITPADKNPKGVTGDTPIDMSVKEIRHRTVCNGPPAGAE